MGRFEIREEIGHGGMGTVFLAVQRDLGREVALKVLPSDLAGDPDYQARFHEEARAVARLNHPSIVTLHDYGEDTGVAYMVAEYIEGGTLEAALGSPLPLDRTLTLLAPIAAALDFAHSRGVIHRDVKPANVLMRNGAEPVLADFGLARIVGGDSSASSWGLIGSPEYMSPEQCSGEPVSAATDTYALAVIAYEMLTGRRPFTAGSTAGLIAAHMTQSPAKPSAINRDLNPEVDRALLKALAKQPQDRQPTAGQLLSDLEQARRVHLRLPVGRAQVGLVATPLVIAAVVLAWVVAGPRQPARAHVAAAAATAGGPPISTVAGSGAAGYGGDGGSARAALLSDPAGVAVDGAGNVYVSDTRNYRVRRVAPDGTITTIAGNGTPGTDPPDGEAADTVSIGSCYGIAVDATGTVYVADSTSHEIHRLLPDGTIERAAGDGYAGYQPSGAAQYTPLNNPAGVAVGPDGRVYIADTNNNRVRVLTTDYRLDDFAGTGAAGRTGDGGPALQAELNQPRGVAVDAHGDVFIADTSNALVREVTPDGMIRTIAGTTPGFSGDGGPATTAQLSYAYGVAVDASGAVYIADTFNNRVRRVDPSGGITTFAGAGVAGGAGDAGPAAAAQLDGPQSVAVDARGDLYIADSGNNRVRRVEAPS